VALRVVNAISHECVRSTLKKTNLTQVTELCEWAR
jgi:hypothetical protein